MWTRKMIIDDSFMIGSSTETLSYSNFHIKLTLFSIFIAAFRRLILYFGKGKIRRKNQRQTHDPWKKYLNV